MDSVPIKEVSSYLTINTKNLRYLSNTKFSLSKDAYIMCIALLLPSTHLQHVSNLSRRISLVWFNDPTTAEYLAKQHHVIMMSPIVTWSHDLLCLCECSEWAGTPVRRWMFRPIASCLAGEWTRVGKNSNMKICTKIVTWKHAHKYWQQYLWSLTDKDTEISRCLHKTLGRLVVQVHWGERGASIQWVWLYNNYNGII